MGRSACGQLSEGQSADSGNNLWDRRKVTICGTVALPRHVVRAFGTGWGQPELSPSVVAVGNRLSGDSLWDFDKVTVYGTWGMLYRGRPAYERPKVPVYGMKAASSSQKQSPERRHSGLTVYRMGDRRA